MAGDLMNMHRAIAAKTMQFWFTAQELADAAREGLFEGLPATKRGVLDLVEREAWRQYHALVRTESGRGGTITRYHIDLLPLDVRLSYCARFVRPEPGDCTMSSPEPVIGAGNLTERARLARDARLVILRLAQRFPQTCGLSQAGADALFVQIFNSGRIELPEWVHSQIGTISARSLRRWRSAAEKKGGDALGHDTALARKGSGLLETANDGAVKAFILGSIANNPALAAKHVRTHCRDEFGDEIAAPDGTLHPMPPLRTFQHFLKGLKKEHNVVLTKLTNPDKYRSTMRLRGTGALSHITEANQLWQIDASPADILSLDNDRVARHTVYVCTDIATHRTVITMSLTPRAAAVALLIRKAIIAWGVPTTIKTDNGSDFVAKDTKRLFETLGVEMELSDAYCPEQKGHVERLIRTFQHDFAVQVPGYVGHSVSERKQIEARKSFAKRLGADDKDLFNVKLSPLELQTQIDEWVELVYHETPHSSLNGLSPAEAARRSTTAVRRIDERALDVLLMPVAGKDGMRRMTAHGIRIDGHYYHSAAILPGSDVFVRHDPTDMGRVLAFDPETSRFLAEAICPELAGVARRQFIAAQKQVHGEIVKEIAGPIQAEVRRIAKGPSGIERTLRIARGDAARRAEAAANVVNLPRREETHSTPEIEAALDAAATKNRMAESKPLNEKAAELHEAILRDHEIKAGSKVVELNPEATLSETARMFKWALDMEAAIAAGDELDDATAGKLVRFQRTGEYQSMKDCFKDFGLENTLKMF